MNADFEKTLRPESSGQNSQSAPDKTQIFSASDKTQILGNTDKTVLVKTSKEIADVVSAHETEYLLEGKLYKLKSVLSESTGEGKILLVENSGNEYVLKLYHEGLTANHEVLEIVQRNSGKYFVDTICHGIWRNPKNSDDLRDFELMSYCSGGSLDSIDLKKSEEKLKEIATMMASAIDFCHKNQIIHRDIKPGNFFFTDSKRNKLVIGDFGISVICNKNGACWVNQSRTRIYAAPELYYIVPGETQVEIDVKSDFYSLGMSLICLWMGEKAFRQQEHELMKKKRTGDLPLPDVSAHTLQLIKALLVPDPEKRAGFEEVKRWAKGENIFFDDIKTDFKAVFSKDKTAHSPEELAKIMYEEQALAIKYLYSGKISKWLEDNQRPELAMRIEEITEKFYPKDETAGLHAACYLLDESMPYYDIKGKPCTSVEDIALSLKTNFSHYLKSLSSKTDPLFVFFNSHGQGEIATRFSQLIKKNGQHSLWQLIYTLNNELPYELKTEEGKKIECSTVAEIVSTADQYVLDDESWNNLAEESFMVWLAGRDPGLAGKIRKLLSDANREEDAITWAVLYNLDPKVDFFLSTDSSSENYTFTCEDVAYHINSCLLTYMNDNSAGKKKSEYESGILDMMIDLQGTRIYHYLKSKGIYNSKIDWINYCFELDSKENQKKSAPYDWVVATVKALKGMGIEPVYELTKSGKYIRNLDELESSDKKEVAAELKDGWLKQWMTIFFQENPQADLSKKFNFEQLTYNYVRYIETFDKTDATVKNFHIAFDYAEGNRKKVNRSYMFFKNLRIAIGILCFIPMAVFAALLIYYQLPFEVNPLPSFSGIAMLVLIILCSLVIYMMGDFENLTGSLFVGVLAAALLYYGTYALFESFMPYAHWIIVAALGGVAFYLVKSCYLSLPAKNKAYSDVIAPGFEQLILEPLHFTFKAKEGEYFTSSIATRSLQYIDYLKKNIIKLGIRGGATLLITIGLGYLFFEYSPAFGRGGSDQLIEAAKLRSFETRMKGTFDGKEASLSIKELQDSVIVSGYVFVNFNNPVSEKIKGVINLKTKSFKLEDITENGTLDGDYIGTISEDLSTLSGVYQNRKTGKRVEFVFNKPSK